MLRPEDIEILERLGFNYRVEPQGQVTHLVLGDYQLPPGLNIETTDLLVQLPSGFPDLRPDMFWCNPPVHGCSGSQPPGTGPQQIGAVAWQRWSRHIGAAWRPGIDDLETYLVYIRRCLLAEASPLKVPVPA